MCFKQALNLLLIEIDFFKLIYDGHTYKVGDNCLVHITSLLTQCCDLSGDMVAQYGGEEFCILLPELTPSDIFEMAHNDVKYWGLYLNQYACLARQPYTICRRRTI